MDLTSPLAGRRALIAEDQSITALALNRSLVRAGILVVAAVDSGTEAVKAAIRERPDIILMDVDLPEMNGLEAARAIKSSLDTCIIFCTAYDAEYLDGAGAPAGCGSVFKPVFSETLIPMVEDFYAAHAARSNRQDARTFPPAERTA